MHYSERIAVQICDDACYMYVLFVRIRVCNCVLFVQRDARVCYHIFKSENISKGV